MFGGLGDNLHEKKGICQCEKMLLSSEISKTKAQRLCRVLVVLDNHLHAKKGIWPSGRMLLSLKQIHWTDLVWCRRSFTRQGRYPERNLDGWRMANGLPEKDACSRCWFCDDGRSWGQVRVYTSKVICSTCRVSPSSPPCLAVLNRPATRPLLSIPIMEIYSFRCSVNDLDYHHRYVRALIPSTWTHTCRTTVWLFPLHRLILFYY